MSHESTRIRLFLPVAAVVYLALIVGIVWTMFAMRRSALVEFSTPQAQAEWDQWRDEVAQRQASGENSVQRRVPKSPEPNALVLVRDFFGTCLFAAVFFTSLLFWIFAFLVRGAFFTQPTASTTMET